MSRYIRIRRILPRAENKIENSYSPAGPPAACKYITTTCSLLCICLLVQDVYVSCTTQRKWTQRGNVVIERNESHLLLSPIGIITNRPFNCDGRTDEQTYRLIAASDARLCNIVASR